MIAANVAPQSVIPINPTKSFNPNVTVFILVDLVNVYALIKSFHVNTPCIVATVNSEFVDIEMGYEENDPEIIPEIQEMLDEFQKNFDSIRVKTLLSGEYDSENAICGRITAG